MTDLEVDHGPESNCHSPFCRCSTDDIHPIKVEREGNAFRVSLLFMATSFIMSGDELDELVAAYEAVRNG